MQWLKRIQTYTTVLKVRRPKWVFWGCNQSADRSVFLLEYLEKKLVSFSFITCRGHLHSLAQSPFLHLQGNSVAPPNISNCPLLLPFSTFFFFFFFLIGKGSFFFFFNQLEANYFITFQWVLSYIDMNQPWIYMYSTSRSPLPPPSLPNPSGSSQCTRPKHLSHASHLAGDLFHYR